MVDFTKPVQTRNGRKARVLCTNAKTTQPVVVLYEYSDGREALGAYNADGSFWPSGSPSENDLVNVPEKRTGWINVYPASISSETYHGYASDVHKSRKLADEHAHGSRIACVEVTYEVPAC